MEFRQLFDRETCTYTYLLVDEASREAVLIDPVMAQVDRDSALLEERGCSLVWVLETHIHADHITGSAVLRSRWGGQHVVGAHSGMEGTCRKVHQGEPITFGHQQLEVCETPGHTEGCVTYVHHASARAFTGDALLIGGCGRTDFQGGDASTLYASVHGQIFSLPDATTLYPGHDYKGRTHTTVGEEKAHNPRLGGGRSLESFQAVMAALDLSEPARIHLAVPANLKGGDQ
jgi:sulfur dioxygenase